MPPRPTSTPVILPGIGATANKGNWQITVTNAGAFKGYKSSFADYEPHGKFMFIDLAATGKLSSSGSSSAGRN